MKIDVLKEPRDRIDVIDDQLLALLQQRAEMAVEIGRVKKEHSIPIPDRAREKEVLERLSNQVVDGPLTEEAIKEIFSTIIRVCRSAQAPIRVAFLGPAGTFSHAAALDQFGSLGIYQSQDDLPAIFDEVESGRSDLGVVPFENSIEGIVGQTLDLLGGTSLKTRGMVTMRISLALMSKGLDMSTVKRVASHPQPLAQARGWLSLNLPGVEMVATASTAAAATLLDDEGSVAIVGHPSLAGFHGLNIVAENIEDQPHNQTFFLIMGRDQGEATGHDRTMCWFSAPHSSGSLYACLQPLADTGVNMTRLHSRPCLDKPWEYRFFLELEGHYSDERVTRALEELQKNAETFCLLGSYEAVETATGSVLN